LFFFVGRERTEREKTKERNKSGVFFPSLARAFHFQTHFSFFFSLFPSLHLLNNQDTAVTLTSAIVSSVSRFAAQVAVSLVLSFVVVWDLPTIAAGFRSLETSRLSPIYKEVAPSVAVFGQLFGKALQAQARIALVNTGLTAAGLVALAIPGVGLLSLFVFLCSFIPIAGCFISTVPIAFVALTEYGFLKVRRRGGLFQSSGFDLEVVFFSLPPLLSLSLAHHTPQNSPKPLSPFSSPSSSSWSPASTSSRPTA